MKNKNKKPIFGKKNKKKWIKYPLLVVLTGIFLLPKIAYFSTITDEKIIELTNKERKGVGVSQVTANQLLTKAAREKGLALFRSQTFQHNIDDKKFSSWIKDAGYEYSYVGENLAIDFVSSEGALEAWMDSPTHRKNIINDKFTEIGVAVLEGYFQGKNTTLVVQIFGTPLNLPNTQTVLTDLKNPETILPGIAIETENLLTNIQSAKTNTYLLDDELELYNPKDYLTVLKINPAQAEAISPLSRNANYQPLFSGLALFFLNLIAAATLINFYLHYYRKLAGAKNINQ